VLSLWNRETRLKLGEHPGALILVSEGAGIAILDRLRHTNPLVAGLRSGQIAIVANFLKWTSLS
jgi:hypothetical protein